MEVKDVIKSGGETLIFNASRKIRDNQIVLEQDLPDEEEVKVKPKVFRFKPEMVEKLKQEYSKVIVRDFGDSYHISDEERKKQFDLYDEYKKIGRHKSKYRNIIEFVNAMRDCIDFLVKMGNKNSIFMNPDDFVKKTLSGEINVDFFTFPKYTGIDKKDINWHMITQYILDPEKDPKELQMKKEINYLSIEQEEDPDKYLREMFSEEAYNQITSTEILDPTGVPYDEDFDGYNTRGRILPVTKKQFKRTLKEFPDLIRGIKDVQKSNNIQTQVHQYDYIFDEQQSAMNEILKMDKKIGYKSADGAPEFKGDVLSRKDYLKYLLKVDDWIKDHQIIPYHGKYMTMNEVTELEMKDLLSEYGYDVRKLYDYEEDNRKREEAIKRDRKKENRLKKRLKELEDRRKAHEGKEMINTKKKKNKKAKKKVKKFSNSIANANGYSNFKAWEKDMTEWT